jgi:hypothetical protein
VPLWVSGRSAYLLFFGVRILRVLAFCTSGNNVSTTHQHPDSIHEWLPSFGGSSTSRLVSEHWHVLTQPVRPCIRSHDGRGPGMPGKAGSERGARVLRSFDHDTSRNRCSEDARKGLERKLPEASVRLCLTIHSHDRVLVLIRQHLAVYLPSTLASQSGLGNTPRKRPSSSIGRRGCTRLWCQLLNRSPQSRASRGTHNHSKVLLAVW